MYSIKVLSFKKYVREETLLESRLLYKKKNAHLTQIHVHVCTLFMFNYIQLQIVKNIHDMSNLRLFIKFYVFISTVHKIESKK